MKNASLFRIFVILAVLTGVGTIAVTQFIVRPYIKTIIDQREANKRNWQDELARVDKLTSNLKDTEEKLARTEKDLDESRRHLAAARERTNEQQARADTLQKSFDVTKRDLNETLQRFAAWKALEIPVEVVKQVIESEKRLRNETAKLRQDLELALNENERLARLVAEFVRPDEAPPMPGVKGTILAIDPKWNFVVLDVGEKAGAKQRGVFMVSRNGKLVGKVKVATVQPDRSIANVVPGWQLGEILEGDQVIF